MISDLEREGARPSPTYGLKVLLADFEWRLVNELLAPSEPVGLGAIKDMPSRVTPSARKLAQITSGNLRSEAIDGDLLCQYSAWRAGRMVERIGPADRRFIG